ncbi:hypothetical protein EDB92DRAFT_2118603 [Lactarius akahatsu]|uniref:CBS domain-containing protein n=1 Tax=Lactarius akahatsu TaxID=416441 RepID=A0AAD4L4F5_9AGAM|nr:hypothetical protein EDB92DRAFT_2118603 [Lactarius akahatsu]
MVKSPTFYARQGLSSCKFSSQRPQSSIRFVATSNTECEEWVRVWENTTAQVEGPVVAVDREIAVEDACDLLLFKGTSCLAIKSADADGHYSGLFDVHTPLPAASTHELTGVLQFADVNAFLTFAATRHTYTPEHLQPQPARRSDPRSCKGRSRPGATREQYVCVASSTFRSNDSAFQDLSEKNPLVELAHDSSVIALLAVLSSGAHRVLVKSPAGSSASHLGVISDPRLFVFFSAFARSSGAAMPPLPEIQLLALCLGTPSLPSLNLHFEVVAVHSRKSVLDAMRMMSDLGVDSVAILEEERCLFIRSYHKSSSDQDAPRLDRWGYRYPVYSVFPSSTLAYTIQKVLATNSHRLFLTSESNGSASPSAGLRGNLSGIVSIGDSKHIHYYSLGLACWRVALTVFSLFARIANIPDVDPARMQRPRRASSGVFVEHVRSSSTGGLRRTSVPRAA